MVPKTVTNIICPGRSNNCERVVLGPMRVQAPIMAMGEASGTAAAMMVKDGSSFAGVDTDAMRRSLDGGESWEPIQVLMEHPSGQVSCGIQSAVVDLETGEVIAFVSMRGVFPKDMGEVWQVEHPEEAKEYRRKVAEEEGIAAGACIITTDDEGEHWSEPRPYSIEVKNPVTKELSPFHLGPGEACVIELGDDSVYLDSRNESLRCRGYRAWDRSDDGGENFFASGYDQVLVEPHCDASLAKFRGSGTPDEILFCNPAVKSDTTRWFDGDARRRLTVRLSTDNCQTWPASKVLAEGGAGYSDMDTLDDGTILCLYEASEPGHSHSDGKLVFARFDKEWLFSR